MSELSYILNSAGERSLIILDEIGRGTSTYDGLSIAWAVTEYLCNNNTHIRTLFATHYHELTALEDKIHGVRNLTVDVSEENGNIVFLHKIVSGSASRSYGIHVAKLAGIPSELLQNAEVKLSELEQMPPQSDTVIQKNDNENIQLSIFEDAFIRDTVSEKLNSIDIMEITPSEAIKALEELKGLVNDKNLR